jgi:hypothetical protein
VDITLTSTLSLTTSTGVIVTAFNSVLDIISSEAKADAENVKGVLIPKVSSTTAVYSNCIEPLLMLEGLETMPKSQIISIWLSLTRLTEISDKLDDIGGSMKMSVARTEMGSSVPRSVSITASVRIRVLTYRSIYGIRESII